MRRQLEYHTKRNNILFDYYSEDREWLKDYIFTVDGKVKYKDSEPLTQIEIQRFIKLYWSL